MANDAKLDRTTDGDSEKATPYIREAHDAEIHTTLKADPSDEEAKMDIALDESFPTSDAPGHTPPNSSEPAPSSGFDEDAEREHLAQRERAYALWESEGRPEGRHDDHWSRANGESEDR